MRLNQFIATIFKPFEKEIVNSVSFDNPLILKESMLYSLTNGGKRVRPLLIYALLYAFGKDVNLGKSSALAIEYIHTYSLIHDDLPAMDDDDYRRGKLTNHKKFDEATAILAGDNLLTQAFGLISEDSILTEKQKVYLIRELVKSANHSGMIGGQVDDMQSEHKQIILDELVSIHICKTAALIRFCIKAVLIHLDLSNALQETLLQFAYHFGLAFQIHNDLKDVSVDFEVDGKIKGRDEILQKNTYISMLGITGTRQSLHDEIEKAKQCIAFVKLQCPNFDDTLMLDFFSFIQ